MTDLKTMSFELNQKQLDAAVAVALPALIGGLAIKYTSGRAPKGTVAEITLSEHLLREAVIAHTKKLVHPAFTHFSISFRPTRGEDGLTTTVVASADEIPPEEPTESQPEPVSYADGVQLGYVAEPAPEEPELVAAVVTDVQDGAVVAEAVEEPAPVAPETSEAPFEGDTSAQPETAAEAAPEVAAEPVADAQPEAVEEVTTADVKEEAPATEEAPKPAARPRLFADLTRPNNAAE